MKYSPYIYCIIYWSKTINYLYFCQFSDNQMHIYIFEMCKYTCKMEKDRKYYEIATLIYFYMQQKKRSYILYNCNAHWKSYM